MPPQVSQQLDLLPQEPGRTRGRRGAALSPRESDLWRLLGEGKLQKEIAAEWRVKQSTVGTTAASLRRKVGVRTNRQLAAMCMAPPNVTAELARLRAEVAGLEAWRRTMQVEINRVTAQRDAAMRDADELRKKIPQPRR